MEVPFNDRPAQAWLIRRMSKDPFHSANALQVQWLELSDGCAGQVQGQDQKGIYSITHQ